MIGFFIKQKQDSFCRRHFREKFKQQGNPIPTYLIDINIIGYITKNKKSE